MSQKEQEIMIEFEYDRYGNKFNEYQKEKELCYLQQRAMMCYSRDCIYHISFELLQRAVENKTPDELEELINNSDTAFRQTMLHHQNMVEERVKQLKMDTKEEKQMFWFIFLSALAIAFVKTLLF